MSQTKNQEQGYELVEAVMKNEIAHARTLLENGADANMRIFTAGREISAMDLAMSHTNPEMVVLLNKYNAVETEEGDV
jgi:hypothetical protein